MNNINLRLERPDEHYVVEELTREAFWKTFWGKGQIICDEHLLVSKLRFSSSFVPKLNYVAEIDGKIVGHIIYSKSKIVDDSGEEHEMLTFGPLSVLPGYQKQGVGKALLAHTLAEAKHLGYRAVIIFGHPSYYPQIGFRRASDFGITTSNGKVFDAFMVYPLYDGALDGIGGKYYYDTIYDTLTQKEALEFDKRFPEKEKVEKKTLNILITAGGTREDIDAVRGITNYATGRLGSLVADEFADENVSITYVCGEDSALPFINADVIRVRNAQGLLNVMEELLVKKKFDCVIHSMAVSDYTPQAVLTADGKPIGQDKKISSDISEIMVYLKQTPKVIGRVKALQPETILVGFKLLMGVSDEELIYAAMRLMEKNSCDYVLANDLNDIKGDSHKALLINEHGVVCAAETKQEIAELLNETIRYKITMKGMRHK